MTAQQTVQPHLSDREEIDASAWVDGKHLRGSVEIFEHARVIPEIKGVLSLIWIPDTCYALSRRYP